jgi:hypothetical protein
MKKKQSPDSRKLKPNGETHNTRKQEAKRLDSLTKFPPPINNAANIQLSTTEVSRDRNLLSYCENHEWASVRLLKQSAYTGTERVHKQDERVHKTP